MSRILKQTKIGGYLVSTVELPFPVIGLRYETMAFKCDKNGEVMDWLEDFCDRYKTADEALEGHANACLSYESKIDPNQMASIMDELDAFIERKVD